MTSINKRLQRLRPTLLQPAMRLLLIMILLFGGLGLAAVQPLYAAGDIYFVGKRAPLGSLTKDGQDQSGIYLRWDEIEGSLPDTITTLRLIRDDGQVLLETAVDAVLSSAEIQALYQGSENQRRLAEIIDRLNDEAEANDGNRPYDSSNFGTEIHNRLVDPQQRFWGIFSSRQDFNIARARNRAFLDPTTESHSYTLYLIDALGEASIAGRVNVAAGQITPLPTGNKFSQLTVNQLARCDSQAERAKAHGTVALNWQTPGATAGERMVSELSIGGYDLYRTRLEPDDEVAALDIRTLAATTATTDDGSVKLSVLERVNDTPILAGAGAAKEERYTVWNSNYFQHLETLPELAASNIEPGDRLAYYLVPRDFTGNYGETVGIEVIVPDVLRPPAPWGIRTLKNEADNSFALSWEHIDLTSYYRDHHRARTFCNLDTARADRKLAYVPLGSSCSEGVQRVINLDVAGYLVYRFDDPEVANRFTDSDADGFSDLAERDASGGPGSACNALVGPEGDAASAFAGGDRAASTVSLEAITVLPGGRRMLQFNDPTPAENRSKVYWYAVAAYDKSGNISPLSTPVRALFPRRDRPMRCDPAQVELGEEVCEYTISPAAVVSAAGQVGQDTSGDAEALNIICTNGDSTTTVSMVLRESDDSTESNFSAYAYMDEAELTRLAACVSNGGNQLTYQYVDRQGRTLAEESTSSTMPIATTLSKDCSTKVLRSFEFGQKITSNTLLLSGCDVAETECIVLYREIGGEPRRIERRCGPLPAPLSIDVSRTALPGTSGDSVCLSYALQTDQNELSARTMLNCFSRSMAELPDAPQMLDVQFTGGGSAGGRASFTLLPPQQRLSGVIYEWWVNGNGRDDAGSRRSGYLPITSEIDPNTPLTTDAVDIPLAVGDGVHVEEWCFRGRSVAYGETEDGEVMSDWSPTHCVARRSNESATADENLPAIPWPTIASPPYLGDLELEYVATDHAFVIRLSDTLDTLSPDTSVSPALTRTCDFDSLSASLDLCLPLPTIASPQPNAIMPRGGCEIIRTAADGKIGFVAYRQRVVPGIAESSYPDYVQVSPLIERIHCRANQSDLTLDELYDPHVTIARAPEGLQVFFVDQYPHVHQYYYRYQLVYFDGLGEIIGYRQTNVKQARLPK